LQNEFIDVFSEQHLDLILNNLQQAGRADVLSQVMKSSGEHWNASQNIFMSFSEEKRCEFIEVLI